MLTLHLPREKGPLFHADQPRLSTKAALTASGTPVPVYKFPSPALSSPGWSLLCSQMQVTNPKIEPPDEHRKLGTSPNFDLILPKEAIS